MYCLTCTELVVAPLLRAAPRHPVVSQTAKVHRVSPLLSLDLQAAVGRQAGGQAGCPLMTAKNSTYYSSLQRLEITPTAASAAAAPWDRTTSTLAAAAAAVAT